MSETVEFVDTNVLLRPLVNDDDAHVKAARTLFEQAEAGNVQLFTTATVIAEVVWVLESAYGLSAPLIDEKVRALVHTPGLEIESSDLVLQASLWYAEKNVDFLDAYSAAWMQSHGIARIRTFDRRHFSRFPDLDVIAPDADL